MTNSTNECSLSLITEAARAMQGVVHKTPILSAKSFGMDSGGNVLLKPENLQRTGSFKVRGAYNRIRSLSSDEKKRGVVAASAGNHAQGVALAATMMGISSTVVMPSTVPIAKAAATEGYGAKVVLCGQNYDEAYRRAMQIASEEGQVFIHPFDDLQVIAGQGTLGLEILQDVPDVDMVVVPIGGGGLAAGVASAIKALKPQVTIVGVQAEGAQSMYRSFKEGMLVPVDTTYTIADGLAVKVPGTSTFEIIKRLVDDVVTVTDGEIARAVLSLLERAKLVVEGAGAAALAAVLHRKLNHLSHPSGQTVVLLTGGNIDVNVLARIIDKGLLGEGRYLRMATCMKDKPGELQRFLKIVADLGGNVVTVHNDRLRHDIALGEAEVEIVIEARDRTHRDAIINAIMDAGYPVRKQE